MSIFRTLDVSEDLQDLLARYVNQIHQQWEADLSSLILFGSVVRGDYIAGRSNINVLLVVKSIAVTQLQRAATLHKEWGKHQIIAPLMMGKEELEKTARLFPLEYLQMTQHHVVLSGQDPFGNIDIDRNTLSWQCEQELTANLLRVRQRFIEGEGRIEAIQALLILSITAVLPCLRGLLYCLGHSSDIKDQQILETLPSAMQFDAAIFVEILNMKKGLSTPGSLKWIQAYQRYLQCLEEVLERVPEIRRAGNL